MSRYAVIDFGSNTIRLCIYALPDVPSDSLTKKDITVLLNYKEMAGISSYVKNGKLSEKGIKKASRILREQIERASYFSPDAVRVFATAVLRNAKNSESAKQAIEKNCGVPITLLTNEEEALLGLAGASLDGSIETATLVDIGGGSTELTALSKGKLQAATSLPLGSLSSFTPIRLGHLAKHERDGGDRRGVRRALRRSSRNGLRTQGAGRYRRGDPQRCKGVWRCIPRRKALFRIAPRTT